jgi:hypothetical protein
VLPGRLRGSKIERVKRRLRERWGPWELRFRSVVTAVENPRWELPEKSREK